MFDQMVFDLRQGGLPDGNLLRKRFAAALVKKMGVIRAPYSFWPADTKINPPAKQLLWAAILLLDKENFSMVEAIIAAELEEKQRAKGEPAGPRVIAPMVQELLQAHIREFIELAPSVSFKGDLRFRVKEVFPSFRDP